MIRYIDSHGARFFKPHANGKKIKALLKIKHYSAYSNNGILFSDFNLREIN